MDYKLIYDTVHNNGYMGYPGKLDEDHVGAYGFVLDYVQKTNLEYDSVLDVGCSIGNGIKLFTDMGKKTLGIDVSEIAVNFAKDRGLNALCASVLDLPLEDNSFDLVVSTDMLEHLIEDDVPKGVNELIRVTRHYLALKIATIPETSGRYWPEKVKSICNIDIVDLHLSVWKSDKWKEFFENKNLQLLCDTPIGGFVILIYKKLNK